MYSVVQELLSDGYLRETGNPGASGGSGPVRVALASASGLFVGIDLGHGHVACAIGTGSANVLAGPRSSGPINVDGLGPAALGDAMRLVRELLEGSDPPLDPADIVGIGVGVPGPLTPANRVASPRYLKKFVAVNIAEQALRAFQDAFGSGLAPAVTCENDANLGALGETTLGVASGVRDAVYVKASTGLGAGLLLGGEIWRGRHGLAGEFGHTSIRPEPDDDLLAPVRESCPRCSQRYCLENTISAEALLARLRVLSPEQYADATDFEVVIDALRDAPSEHQVARDLLLRAGERLGRSLANVVRLLDPEVVIVGGKLARAGSLVGQPIRDAVSKAAVGETRAKVLLVEREEVPFSEARGAMMLAIRNGSPVSD